MLETNNKKTAPNNGSLKHFDMKSSETLNSLCPWIFKEDGGKRLYACNQENRPPYRHVDGSCNHLSGQLPNYD